MSELKPMNELHQTWQAALDVENYLRRLTMSAVEMDSTETLPQLLSDIRIMRSLSLQALSDASGVAKSYLWELEQGRKAKGLSIHTATRIADALDVPALRVCAAAMRSQP